MSSTKYLVIFYGVSAGQNGPNLGSDEQDLVMLIFLVIDTEENKVKDTLSTLFFTNVAEWREWGRFTRFFHLHTSYISRKIVFFLHMVKYKPMWTYGSFFPRFRLDKLKTSVPLNCSQAENDKLKFRYNVKFLDIQTAS